MRVTSIVGVPIDCTGRLAGCERAPAVLRESGLTRRLDVRDHGDLPVTLDDPTRHRESGIIAYEQVIAVSTAISNSLSKILRDGEKPLVVGGDCTLLIGVAGALRDVYGRAGLVFIDGHMDCYDGATSPTGECADMDLAIVTGTGPNALTGDLPMIAPGDVMALGIRDLDAAKREGSPDPDPGIVIVTDEVLQRIMNDGNVGAVVASGFTAYPGHFWVHLDLDVLDNHAMSAVDYPMPGGLGWDQLWRIVRPLVLSPGFRGMDVTIYNPTLDPDRAAAAKIVDFLSRVLT